jgi:glycosyltransferase involved in cell wall biosynthesis
MKRADVFVSPAHFEGNPNVVLEAMTAGVPLVVSDIGEHRELLDDGAALLVPAISVDAVAAAIRETLTDRQAAAVRAAAARRLAEARGIATIAARYDDVYRGLMAGKRAA